MRALPEKIFPRGFVKETREGGSRAFTMRHLRANHEGQGHALGSSSGGK